MGGWVWVSDGAVDVSVGSLAGAGSKVARVHQYEADFFVVV